MSARCWGRAADKVPRDHEAPRLKPHAVLQQAERAAVVRLLVRLVRLMISLQPPWHTAQERCTPPFRDRSEGLQRWRLGLVCRFVRCARQEVRQLFREKRGRRVALFSRGCRPRSGEQTRRSHVLSKRRSRHRRPKLRFFFFCCCRRRRATTNTGASGSGSCFWSRRFGRVPAHELEQVGARHGGRVKRELRRRAHWKVRTKCEDG
mmetsp:Transcript_5555/g.11638  ORF Transcript_5555/g.11638 Transcript_5555/m.11638 type:complete len:206 (-) Transcript_5555:98-715(-)